MSTPPSSGLDLRGARAWTLVLGIATAQLVSWGTLFYAFAVYVVPMETEPGWSRPELNGALSIGLLVAGLLSLPVGALIDRGHGRTLMTLGSLLGAALLATWPLARDLPLFYALWAGIGVAMAATLNEPAFAVVTFLFPRDYRRAITAVTLVGGLASTVFIPLTQFLIERMGWRDSLFVLAGFNVACALCHALLIPPAGPPPARTTRTDGRGPLAAALRRASFWALTLSFAFDALTFTSLLFHLVPMMRERGLPMGEIVAGYAVIGPMQVAGRVLVTTIGRDLSTRAVGLIVVAAYPVALAVLMLARDLATMMLFAVVYGLANGVVTIIRGVVVADLYGREGYGAVSGAMSTPATFARAGAPLAAAWAWQELGGYGPVLWLMMAAAIVSAAAFALAMLAEARRNAAD